FIRLNRISINKVAPVGWRLDALRIAGIKDATRLLRTPAALVDLGLIDHFCFGDLVNKVSIDRVQMDQRPHFSIEEVIKEGVRMRPNKNGTVITGQNAAIFNAASGA